MKLKMLAIAAFAVAVAGFMTGAHADTDPVLGDWYTLERKSKITIQPCGDSICGAISWLAAPNNDQGQPKVDSNNEDSAMRARPLLGMQILNGYSKDSAGVWKDGTIYNATDGQTYTSHLTVGPDGKLEVEGCLLIFCQSQTWEPVTN